MALALPSGLHQGSRKRRGRGPVGCREVRPCGLGLGRQVISELGFGVERTAGQGWALGGHEGMAMPRVEVKMWKATSLPRREA